MGVSLPPFQTFLEQHREPVYRFLVASVGAHEADDCFQETFISALRAYPRLRPDSNLRAWVLTVAHRKVLDAHRARKRRPQPVPELVLDGAASTPEHDDALWQAVRALPEKQRGSVVLRFANDLSHDEIGRVLGCSEQAARRNLHEAMKTLREVWPE